jgi:GNAT superfamily N-acetyltransferase
MNRMEWPSLEELTVWAPMPAGYGYKLPSREDVPRLIAAIEKWYPDIAVGAASGYTRVPFYEEKVHLQGDDGRKDICVFMYMKGDQLVGFGSIERESDALTIYGRIMVIDPEHQGAKLGSIGMAVMDGMGLYRGAEFLYLLVTMKHPHAQKLLERRGYRPIGLVPGYDREMSADGKILRVFEALYVKVLVSEDELLQPNPEDQTPSTRALLEFLFSSRSKPPVA